VRRTIPHASLKMIGAWCFVDHFGPTKQTDGMVVAAHPHTGLQTVTWLFEGQIEHRDSIGSIQLIEAGQLNLMTAGHGISHSELSLPTKGNLHAVQLWVALPKAAIDIAPAFEHQSELPEVIVPGMRAKVLVGEFMGTQAPTTHFSPLLGVELELEPGVHRIPIDSRFEAGALLVSGSVQISEHLLGLSDLHYWEPGQTELEIQVLERSTLMLLAGEPFGEKILMWWNFIGRTHQDIALAREHWNSRGERFGEFEDQIGDWIPAPELPNVTLTAR
jgi:quercetin 2,3-dioxygenase